MVIIPLQTTSRNEFLLKRYPFLKMALEDAMQYFSEVNTKVTITVKHGDPNLLYRACDNAWHSRRFFNDTSNPNMQIKQLEWFYPVNTRGELGMRRECKSYDPTTLFVRSLFEHIYLRDWPSEGKDPFEAVDNIVWVTLGHWYEGCDYHVRGSRDRPDKRGVSITLFRQPRWGWKRLFTRADPLKNVRLFGPQLLPGIKSTDELRIALAEATKDMARQLTTSIAAQGLGEIIRTCPSAEMSGVIDDIQIRSLVHRGRLMIALERGDVSFTVIGRDDFDNPQFSCQDISGTIPEVGKMLNHASKRWRALSWSRRLAAY